MKEITNKNILKRAIVLLIATVMVLSTVAVTANTNDQPEFMLAGADIPQPQQTNAFDPDWMHFDSGNNVNSLGIINGGTFESAIRLTPDELADLAGYQISVVRHHHGYPNGPPFQMSGNIKIYDEGTSTIPGSLITTEPFEVTANDWFDVNLSEPLQITGDKDIWVSVEATHNQNEYPAGFDDSEAVDGKGDWIYMGGVWGEIQDIGYDFNWNIWVKVDFPSEPPEKPQEPDGPTEGVVGVEYMFFTSTTDPEEEQVSYMWDWDDETPTEWTDFYNSGETMYADHIWNESGDYNITVKAKDLHDVESEWSVPKTIHIVDTANIEIGDINGHLFKVSTVIKNNGGVDATRVNCSITFTGGIILLGKETTGNILSIPAGEEAKVSSSLIFGFGKTMITATAECAEGSSDTNTRDAFVFLFFIF